jgi:hypothetical protein
MRLLVITNTNTGVPMVDPVRPGASSVGAAIIEKRGCTHQFSYKGIQEGWVILLCDSVFFVHFCVL